MNDLVGLLVALFAGLTTLIGTFIVFAKKINRNKLISFSLGLSSGVMITLALSELLVESIETLNSEFDSILGIIIVISLLLVGIGISYLIDYFVDKHKISAEKTQGNNLYKIGLLSLIALAIHNIPEGLALYIASTSDIKLGITLGIGVAIHNIPVGISIALPIYYSSKSKKKAILLALCAALAQPLGALFGIIFLKPFINEVVLAYLFAVIAGMLLFLVFSELLPESYNYKNKKLSFIGIITGIIIILFSLVLH